MIIMVYFITDIDKTLTLTALHIFCICYIKTKYYVIYQAINDIIFIISMILMNSRMTPGVLKTL